MLKPFFKVWCNFFFVKPTSIDANTNPVAILCLNINLNEISILHGIFLILKCQWCPSACESRGLTLVLRALRSLAHSYPHP